MALRRPLVLLEDGSTAELPSGDTLPGGGGDPWQFVVQTEDFETSLGSHVPVPGLAVPIDQPNARYWISGRLFLQTTVTTVGARPGLSWPTGTLQEIAKVGAAASTSAITYRFWGAPSTQSADAGGQAVINEGWWGEVEAVIVTGPSPAGALQVTLRSETAGTIVRCMRNSFLSWRLW